MCSFNTCTTDICFLIRILYFYFKISSDLNTLPSSNQRILQLYIRILWKGIFLWSKLLEHRSQLVKLPHIVMIFIMNQWINGKENRRGSQEWTNTRIPPKTTSETMCSRRVSSYCFLWELHVSDSIDHIAPLC